MPKQDFAPEHAQLIGIKIKSIKKLDNREDVYCLSAQKNRNMLANDIVVRNCDALRYALATHKVSVYDPYKEVELNKNYQQNKYTRYTNF